MHGAIPPLLVCLRGVVLCSWHSIIKYTKKQTNKKQPNMEYWVVLISKEGKNKHGTTKEESVTVLRVRSVSWCKLPSC